MTSGGVEEGRKGEVEEKETRPYGWRVPRILGYMSYVA